MADVIPIEFAMSISIYLLSSNPGVSHSFKPCLVSSAFINYVSDSDLWPMSKPARSYSASNLFSLAV